MPAAKEELELEIPRCEKGLGHVILKTDAFELIDGVKVTPYALWPDDRGYFLEVARLGQGPSAGFRLATTQISAALSYPGTIKAFHFHKEQTDCWVPVQGLLQVALVDLRKSSSTFGVRNTLYTGALRPWQLIVPPGVAHGYKVIGVDSAMLVYLTDRYYNPKDEGRIAYDDPRIAYDWEIQHK